jgi:signal transduction histidine kinase
VTIWQPIYWLQGWADAVTAGASVLTAIVIWPLLPRVLAMPSTTDLQTANHSLAESNRRLETALADRRRLGEQLEAQNALLEKIFANTDFLLAYMTPTFDFVRVNQAYSVADGKTPADFEGKNHFALYPNAENEAIFRTVVQSGEPYAANARPFIYPGRPDLTTYWDWSLQPVRDALGKVEGLLLTLVNVTKGKQAEQALERKAEELARSNQELERFAYVASHDLRAPLRAIDNLATWIDDDEGAALSDTARGYLNRLRSRVRRMEAMVEDLLAYSRAGRVHHDAVTVDTGALLHDVVEIIAPPPGFTVTPAGPLPVLTTERVPLETIFRNLIGNAVKHYDRATPGAVTVRADDHGAWIEFVVADNGPGIDPEYHDRIFQLFQTLKPRDQVEGSGMGLAIVKKLVESRGGRIWLVSSGGAGAAFHFTWPAAPPAP